MASCPSCKKTYKTVTTAATVVLAPYSHAPTIKPMSSLYNQAACGLTTASMYVNKQLATISNNELILCYCFWILINKAIALTIFPNYKLPNFLLLFWDSIPQCISTHHMVTILDWIIAYSEHQDPTPILCYSTTHCSKR